MAQFQFTDLMDEILPYCAGAGEPMIENVVRRIVRNFLKRTNFLTITSDPKLDITVDEALYNVTEPAGLEIIRVLKVFVDTKQLTHRSADQFDREHGGADRFTSVNYGLAHHEAFRHGIRDPWRLDDGYPPFYWYQPRPRCVRLVPIPSESVTATLEIQVSVRPSITAVSVEDWIINNWYETIVKGVVGEMLLVPKKKWTDRRLGLEKKAEYEDETEELINERAAGFHDNSYAVGRTRVYP